MGVEWNGNLLIQAVYMNQGDKDPKIVVAPQVLVCALIGHTETAKRYGNTAVNLSWDDHSV